MAAPISLYGATKLASEVLHLNTRRRLPFRYGLTDADYWPVHSSAGPIKASWPTGLTPTCGVSLCAIGFGGGRQVRDAMHPRDLAALIAMQIDTRKAGDRARVINVAEDGTASRVNELVRGPFGFDHRIADDPVPRPLIYHGDNGYRSSQTWTGLSQQTYPGYSPSADHAEQHPDWLSLSAPL
ncbi:MAG: hypothetical protein WKF37_14680 [Bryobacteraceae bacterium]